MLTVQNRDVQLYVAITQPSKKRSRAIASICCQSLWCSAGSNLHPFKHGLGRDDPA